MAGRDAPYAQIETILNVVLKDPAFTNGSGPFQRTVQVTLAVSDYKVSAHKVLVHPEWAVELGPLVAAQRIKQAAKEFDARVSDARHRQLAELRSALAEVAERVRQAGAEELLEETRHASVPRRRALVRREG